MWPEKTLDNQLSKKNFRLSQEKLLIKDKI
jgi:hypothetical protein